MTPFEGVVLVGGSSARMGENKALLDFAGAPLFRRSVNALTAAGATRVSIVGGAEQEFAGPGVVWQPDETPGAGPLAAVISSLARAESDAVVVLSCDLPAITDREVHLLRSVQGDASVVVPVVSGHRQWMTTLFATTARDALESALATGETRMWAAAAGLRTVYLFDERVAGYVDVDTPGDLEAARTPGSVDAG